MEGVLLVPPDRGTIIGRAIWKPRYIVVGPQDARPGQLEQLAQASLQQQKRLASSARSQHSQTPRAATPRSHPTVVTETANFSPLSMHLSIYKCKDDREPAQQYALSSINDCQVQMLSHRKQGPVLPTLVLGISPDPITDKIRKRRSSRTAGLTSREITPTSLWFRPVEEHNQKHILQDWCHAISSLLTELAASSPSTAVAGSSLGPLSSPVTPASPTFSNPFAPSPQTLPQSRGARRLGSEASTDGRAAIAPNQKTSTSNQTSKNSHSHGHGHGHGHAHANRERERSKTYSESPSLRSRRSDLSHTSSNVAPHTISTTQAGNYAAPFYQSRPADLPSPATTVNEFQGDQVEGWTNALGRLSVSASTTSASLATKATAASNSSSPPAPRETILDRAFQLRYIPGSDREPGGEEKMSSLARFDALMREEEERRRQRLAQATSTPRPGQTDTEPKSGWDFDDDDDDSDDDDVDADNSDDDDDDDDGCSVVRSDGASSASGSLARSRRGRQSDGIHMRRDHLEPVVEIAPNTRRALEFIAGRHDDAGSAFGMSPRARLGSSSYDAQSLRTPDNGQRLSELRQKHRQAVAVEEEDDEEDVQRQQHGAQLYRPKTGYARNRPSITQRTHSQPQLAAMNRPSSQRLASSPVAPPSLPRASTYTAKSSEGQGQSRTKTPTSSNLPLPLSVTSTTMSSAPGTPSSADKQRPSIANNSKHLSFTEFTKRLSGSTGSLMLAQANTNSSTTSGSSGVSHESDTPSLRGGSTPVPTRQHGGVSSPVLPSPSLPPPPAAERCGWRGSVKVLSSEGGFL